MTVSKRCNSVVQNIFFIVKSVQTGFVNFDCPQEVVGGEKCSKFAVVGFQGLEDVKKSLVLNVFFHIGFLYPLCSNFWAVGDIKTVHFSSKANKFSGS